MQITFHSDELRDAPPAVRDWIQEILNPGVTEPASKPAPKSKSAPKSKKEIVEATTPNGKPEVDLNQVMTAAVRLLETKGEEALSNVLKEVDVRRVKECPPEKLADLLTAISAA